MKRSIYVFLLFCSALLLASCGTYKSLHDKPVTEGYNSTLPVIQKQNDTLIISGKNFLLKNRYGLWEMYVEGDALERGLTEGAMSVDLMKFQEHVFLDKVKK